MPLTAEQEQWLEEREAARQKKSEEAAKALYELFQAKNDAKKNKDKDGKKDKGKDGKDKKDGKSRPASASATAGAEKTPCKYKSASDFMAHHFPGFEDEVEDITQMAPMRRIQLLEVADVLATCQDRHVANIRETALRKALVAPQDKPEALCLEQLREEKEGLMVNPNPPEYWRKCNLSKKGGGKKGKKKKK
jgi:hypothetical protein